MSKTVLYIAMSLDGYIAKPNGNLDWLTSAPTPKDGGDYGYSDLIARVGSTVMGRTTYEEILGFGGEWPYSGLDSFVVTSNPDLEIKAPDTQVIQGDFPSFLADLKATAKKDIWIVGGGKLVKNCLEHGLLDEMIITIVPTLLWEGIPLFPQGKIESQWQLLETKTFDTGFVQLSYQRTLPS